MRILQIIPAYYPAVRYGGPIKSAHGLASALTKRGHEVHVYTSNIDGDRNLDVPLAEPVLLDNVVVHYFPVSRLRRLCWSPSLAAELATHVRSFDIVHLHSVFLMPTRDGARAAQSAGVPYVLSPRGMLGGEVIRRKNRWIKMAWINLVERKTLRNASAVHVTSELEREEIAALGLKTRKMLCIPNGLDIPNEYTSLDEGPFANVPRPYALFLSRINWKKGLDRLLRAWRHIPDLPLVVAGNDEEHYQQELEALAKAEGIDHRVHFVGPVKDQHKWSLYQNASLFILPSYSENFGNVVAEAMAMACPVVVTPEVGLADFVTEARAGLVIGGEPETLAPAVRSLLDAPALRREMGDRGRAAVQSQLSWSAVATHMEQAYLTAISETAANRKISRSRFAEPDEPLERTPS